jgi:hypothetical protein
MKNIIFLQILLTLTLAIPSFAQDKTYSDDLAISLLKSSDRSRGGVEEGLTWNSTLTTIEDSDQSLREFTVKAKDVDALVEATAPLRTKGEIYVFNDRNMWFVKSGLKKPVSISSRAKLNGLASNGDIASTWYARDYQPKIEKEEDLNGEKHYVLFLKAKTTNSTYDQIRYWVNAKTQLASKADYLTLQGQVLKTATFEYKNSLTIGGKSYPFVSKMEIVDGKRQSFKSVIQYANLKSAKFRTGEFNINNVRK